MAQSPRIYILLITWSVTYARDAGDDLFLTDSRVHLYILMELFRGSSQLLFRPELFRSLD